MNLAKIFAFTVLCVVTYQAVDAQNPVSEIEQLLNSQAEAWNEGDIHTFMEGYVESPDLHFLSSNGLTAGWQSTLERYLKRYPDKIQMGTLNFAFEEITRRTDNVYTVIGQYFLTRPTIDDLRGHFLLVVQRIEGQWKIVADSTH